MLSTLYIRKNIHSIIRSNTRICVNLNANNRYLSHTSVVKQQETPATEQMNVEKNTAEHALNKKQPLFNVLKKELADEIKGKELTTSPPSIVSKKGFKVVNNDLDQVILTLKKEGQNEDVYVFIDVDEYVNGNFEADDMSYGEPDMSEDYQMETSPSFFEFVVVKKLDNSAMSFNVLFDETGLFAVEKISNFNDFSLFYSTEANDTLKKNVAYGVNFRQLDPSVQEHMINYLYSMGLNEDLIAYVDEISAKQEQYRYEKWLKDATSFLGP